MILFHGSPFLFDHFDLHDAGSGTGVKFGYGIYLTEVEASAVHYSQPRKLELMPEHYLFKVEIPDLAQGNHLVREFGIRNKKKVSKKVGNHEDVL